MILFFIFMFYNIGKVNVLNFVLLVVHTYKYIRTV